MQTIDYALNFVIPAGEKGETGIQGPIGPTGPQGATGPTGPTVIKAAITINYQNTQNNGVIPLNDASKLLYPRNSTVFTNTTSSITLTQTGLYTFSIFGILKENTTSEGANIILSVGNKEFLSIILDAGIPEISFSKIGFKPCNANEQVELTLNKSSSSNASLESAYVIIQRIHLDS